MAGFQDLMPTFAEVAGTQIPEQTDGLSFLPLLLGKKQEKHDVLTWEFQLSGWFQTLPDGGFRQSARRDNWKAVRYGIHSETELYDLDQDLSESNNLAGEHPEIVEEMNKLMETSRTKTDGFPYGGVVQHHKSQERYQAR
jgi:arylsulfatase A-like enzyme